MNILSIGNSFSQDAQRYLHQIARAGGIDVTCVNLYIGGCSLAQHAENLRADTKAYSMELNGVSSGFYVSIREALESRDWDIVTMQQVSHDSNDYSTYQPYLAELAAYVKQYAPNAEQVLHETWFYEQDSELLCGKMGYKNWEDMYRDIESAYTEAAKSLGNCRIIPSGKALAEAVKAGISVHRDTFHARLGFGRYILGLCWYKTLCDGNVDTNPFCDFDEVVSNEEIEIAKKSVLSAKL